MKVYNAISGNSNNNYGDSEKIKNALIYINNKVDDMSNNFLKMITIIRKNQQLIENKTTYISNELESSELSVKDAYTTKVVQESDKTISNLKKIIERKGVGRINQILIQSPSVDYRVFIMLDDTILFDQNYTFFSTNSQDLAGISAFLDNGKYRLSIRELSFQEKFVFYINPSSEITFDNIIVNYSIRN